MLRRGVSILLVVLQLTVPGLSFAHAHDEAGQEAEHTAQPPKRAHVHLLPFVGHHHHHDHSHGHHHSHGHPDNQTDKHDHDDGQTGTHQNEGELVPSQDQDSDAPPEQGSIPEPCSDDHDGTTLPESLLNLESPTPTSSGPLMAFIKAFVLCAWDSIPPDSGPLKEPDAPGRDAPTVGPFHAPPPIYLLTLHLLI